MQISQNLSQDRVIFGQNFIQNRADWNMTGSPFPRKLCMGPLSNSHQRQ